MNPTAWLESVLQPAPSNRVALEIQEQVVGSVTAADAQWFVGHIEGIEFDGDTLSITPVCGPDSSAVLSQMANLLREAGRLGKWRNELLRVVNDSGDTLGFIERAAVRPLGIKTFAVHLVLYQDNQLWLQQRALDKATDPGLWDTCAGGLVAGKDNFIDSLHRETVEEAGLDIHQLVAQGAKLNYVGTIASRRQLPEGLLIEDLLVWNLILPAGHTVNPINQDGEVAQFKLLSPEKIDQLIADRNMTLEAAVCTRLSLQNRVKSE
jgi:8-oxo-dGTP pyrophosphatase MutT (NUDIX family)